MSLNKIKINSTEVTVVDSKPTNNSHNLIESNGTKQAIDEISCLDATYYAMNYGIQCRLTGYLLQDGTVDPMNGTKISPYVPVTPGQKIVFSGGYSGGDPTLYSVMGFSNLNGSGPVGIVPIGEYSGIEFTVPDDVNYIRAWGSGSHMNYLYFNFGQGMMREYPPFSRGALNKDRQILSLSWISYMTRARQQLGECEYEFVGNTFLMHPGKVMYPNANSYYDMSEQPAILKVDESSNWTTSTKFDGTQTLLALIYGVRGHLHIAELYNSETEIQRALYEDVPICIARLNSDGSQHVILHEFIKNKIQDRSHVKNILQNEVVVSESQTILVGLIDSDGSISENQSFRYTDFIEIPQGVTHIVFDQGEIVYHQSIYYHATPSYVACYSSDDRTSFLGFSDNSSYYDLDYLKNGCGQVLTLKEGTNYISFFAGNSAWKAQGICKIRGGVYQKKQAFTEYGREPIVINSSGGSGGSFIGEPDTTFHFSVNVNCHPVLADDRDTVQLQDYQSMYVDYAMIMLPSNYTTTGQPVPLIIGCHGAGGSVSQWDSQTERATIYQYFVANGYAVCDCNGFPNDWCDEVGVSKLNNIGSPIAMECYTKMYQYVIEHFNVRHEALVTGGSMGGISSSNLVLSGSIPVVAHALFCPVLDAYNQVFLRPWSGGAPKVAMGVVYNLDKDVNDNLIYDEEKLRGFNPTVRGMQSYTTTGERVSSVGTYDLTTHKLNGQDVVEYRTHPCPVKVWHCENDNVVAYACSQRFVNAIRNGGGNAVLRSIITGKHEPLDVGDYLENPSGNTSYRGTTLQIRPITDEILMFLDRYAQK